MNKTHWLMFVLLPGCMTSIWATHDAPLELPVGTRLNALTASNEKKKAYAAIVYMSNVVITIADEMKETSCQVQVRQHRRMKEKNRIPKQKNDLSKKAQLITLAQHLGLPGYPCGYFDYSLASGSN